MKNKSKTKLAIQHGFSFAGEAFSLAVCLNNQGKKEEALAALKVALDADDAQDVADTFNAVNAQAIDDAGITQEEFQDDVDEDSEEVKASLVAIASMLETPVTASDDEDDEDDEDEDEDEDDEDEDEDENSDDEEDSEFDEPEGEEEEFGENVADSMTSAEERSRKRKSERSGRKSHNATLARAVTNKATLGKKISR